MVTNILLIISLIFILLDTLILVFAGLLVLKITKSYQEEKQQQEESIKNFSSMFGGFNLNEKSDD